MADFTSLFGVSSPLIGVVHLPALPGAPGNDLSMDALVERAVGDASAILTGGMDSIVVENYGDAPFYKDRVPAETVAVMACLVRAVVERVGPTPVGVNVLRNDASAALAVATAAGAAFVRVNIHVGAAWTDQGLIEGRAQETLRLRDRLGSSALIFADVGVKHARSASGRPLAEEAADCALRGGADAVIVTGTGTGRAADAEDVAEVKRAVGHLPVLIGSGVTAETAAAALRAADGIIVGSSLRADGRAGGRIDAALVARFVSNSRGRSS